MSMFLWYLAMACHNMKWRYVMERDISWRSTRYYIEMKIDFKKIVNVRKITKKCQAEDQWYFPPSFSVPRSPMILCIVILIGWWWWYDNDIDNNEYHDEDDDDDDDDDDHDNRLAKGEKEEKAL